MAIKIGWFSTGRDEAACQLFQTVLEATENGLINGRISVVFSNNEPGESIESDRFLSLVEAARIPLVTLSSKRFHTGLWNDSKNDDDQRRQWRLLFDREAVNKLSRYSFDLAVLAGYMLIVGEEMCRTYQMINLHPAAPGGPTGTWQEVIWELIKTDADKTGVMMHLVTPELDRGPVITYVDFPIRGGLFNLLWKSWFEKSSVKTIEEIIREEGEGESLFARIRSEGVKREMPLILLTLKVFAEGAVKIDVDHVTYKGQSLDHGYCLNEQVEQYLKEKER